MTITLMVVLIVAEDIEEKIRKLRELGRAPLQRETKPTKPIPLAESQKKISKIGALREKERKKRILIGAFVIIVIILIASIGIYTLIQKQQTKKLEAIKQAKIAEVNTYFKGELANDTVKFELIKRIKSAKSIEELNKINVKAAYEKRLAEIRKQKEVESKKKEVEELNMLKSQQIIVITQAFDQLLSQPLPEDIRTEAINILNELKQRVNEAKTKEEVLSVDPNPYLTNLWKKYYFYLIDATPTQQVILRKDNESHIYTKIEAKQVLGKITDYHELMKYSVEKVEMVKMALVVKRENVVGAFLSSGDKIKIYAKNQTNGKYFEIADEGYLDLILLPTSAGQISLSESQGEGSSISSSSSTEYTTSQSTSYNVGEESLSNSQSNTNQYSTTQSSSESSSAYYNYNVNLAEVLKAIAAGKINAPDDVKEQLSKYGWKIINLENDTRMLVLDPNTEVFVIFEVPSDFVPKILEYKNEIYIVKIETGG